MTVVVVFGDMSASPLTRWLVVVAAAIVVASIAEPLLVRTRVYELAGVFAIGCGAIAATTVGSILFPPMLVSSPSAATFSIVGALAAGLCWGILHSWLGMSRDDKLHNYFRISTALLVCGAVAGVIVWLLSSRTLNGFVFCVSIGLFGGLLLAAPHLLLGIFNTKKPCSGEGTKVPGTRRLNP